MFYSINKTSWIFQDINIHRVQKTRELSAGFICLLSFGTWWIHSIQGCQNTQTPSNKWWKERVLSNAMSCLPFLRNLLGCYFKEKRQKSSPVLQEKTSPFHVSPDYASNWKLVMDYLQIVKYIINTHFELRTFGLLSTKFDTWMNCPFGKIKDSHFHKI